LDWRINFKRASLAFVGHSSRGDKVLLLTRVKLLIQKRDRVMANLHCYKRNDGKWAWRLTADNDEIVAVDGAQGYDHYDDCQKMADKVVINGGFNDARRTKERDG
jgi:uncharacterized protein YegP (UPF0339 family)